MGRGGEVLREWVGQDSLQYWGESKFHPDLSAVLGVLSVLDCSVWMLASPRSVARLPNLSKAKPILYTLRSNHSKKCSQKPKKKLFIGRVKYLIAKDAC